VRQGIRSVHVRVVEYCQLRLFQTARLLALHLGLSLGIQLAALTIAFAAAPGGPPVNAPTTPLTGESSAELSLATTLVDALNRGDEDAAVMLFDPEATLRADRYAWTHFEIRVWARAQIAASLVIEPDGAFQAIPNHAMWTAHFRRADWRERGVESVRMANRIVTEGDRIIDFSADPLDGASVLPLGELWRPGSTPDRPPKRSIKPDLDETGVNNDAPALLTCVVIGLLVASSGRAMRARVTHGRKSRALITALADWQRGRDVIR
jgi:hypothetical protein